VATRPLYDRFAWAYDLVVDRPAGPTAEQVAALLTAQGVRAGSLVIDAGCGTGRHAAALTGLGYRVLGLDRSGALVAQARARGAAAEFVCGDLLAWRPSKAAAAVLCRGVLNDLTADGDRRGAFRALASWLAPGGVLVGDVREWEATAQRYAHGLRHERRVTTRDDTLRYLSETTLDGARRLILVREQYAGVVDGGEVEETYDFAMRCWTAEEAHDHATDAGFASIEVLSGEDAGIAADRLLIVASAQSTGTACALS
jgi:SAM-dependent methyltransferase